MISAKRCKKCGRVIRHWNKGGYCLSCGRDLRHNDYMIYLKKYQQRRKTENKHTCFATKEYSLKSKICKCCEVYDTCGKSKLKPKPLPLKFIKHPMGYNCEECGNKIKNRRTHKQKLCDTCRLRRQEEGKKRYLNNLQKQKEVKNGRKR